MTDADIHSDPHAAAAHQPELVRRHDVVRSMHGDSRVAEINRRLALFITRNVGTMWCAYVFSVIGITGIVAALTNNTALVLLIGAVSGYFLQLVLLPIIIVGQNVQAEASDRRAEADHKTLVALHTMNKTQLQILEALERLSNNQQEVLDRLAAK